MSWNDTYEALLKETLTLTVDQCKARIEELRNTIGDHATNAKLKNWDRFKDNPDTYIHMITAGMSTLDIERVKAAFESNHYTQDIWEMHVVAEASYLPEFRVMRRVYKEALKEPWNNFLKVYRDATKKRNTPKSGSEDTEGDNSLPPSEGLDS